MTDLTTTEPLLVLNPVDPAILSAAADALQLELDAFLAQHNETLNQDWEVGMTLSRSMECSSTALFLTAKKGELVGQFHRVVQ